MLSGYPDLVEHSKLFPAKRATCLMVLPVGHYFRYFLLIRSGNDIDFILGQGATPLYETSNDVGQPYYDRIFDPLVRHYGTLRLDNPDLLDVIGRSVPSVVEFLRAVESPDDFSHYLKAHTWSFSRHDLGEAWARAAAGDFAQSLKMVAVQIERFTWNSPPDDPRLQMEDFQGLLRLDAALKEGKDAVLAVLRENERRNVEKFKLEQYWQPTPFPFE
jgi:hypothetical protein